MRVRHQSSTTAMSVNEMNPSMSAVRMSGCWRPPPPLVITLGWLPPHFCTEKWMMGRFAAARTPSAAANLRSASPSPAKSRSTT